MPRKTRATQKAKAAEDAVVVSKSHQDGTTSPPPSPKGKQRQVDAQAESSSDVAAVQGEAASAVNDESAVGQSDPASTASDTANQEEVASRATMEERKARMAALRKKMSQSSSANRKDLMLDKQPTKPSGPTSLGASRKLAKAEETLDRRDAEERGQDWERMKNWRYTMEDEERWNEKLEAKEEKRDKGMIDPNGLAARSYQRIINGYKPDVKAYRDAKAASSAKASSSPSQSGALVHRGGQSAGQVALRGDADSGAGSISYGSHRPDDNAIDRVVTHMNLETDQRSKRNRKRDHGGDGEGTVDYINDKNERFNKKVQRFFDPYTQETRDAFERGTAL